MAQPGRAEPASSGDEILERVRAALEDVDGVDAHRIDLYRDNGAIILRGWVASAVEASTAIIVAESASEAAVEVRDELQIDEGLREGVVDHALVEPATPAEGEVLVGDVDMLSGPEPMMTEDPSEATEENEPWSPPDHPYLPDPPRRRLDLNIVEHEPEASDEAEDDGPAAADLSSTDLQARTLPGLDEEGSADAERAPDDGGSNTMESRSAE